MVRCPPKKNGIIHNISFNGTVHVVRLRCVLINNVSTQEVEDYRLSNGLAAANMLAEISQADASATRCVHVCLCLSVCLSVFLSLSRRACLSLCLSFCLSACVCLFVHITMTGSDPAGVESTHSKGCERIPVDILGNTKTRPGTRYRYDTVSSNRTKTKAVLIIGTCYPFGFGFGFQRAKQHELFAEGRKKYLHAVRCFA